MLPAEMPTIPMWHSAQQSVWSERVSDVVINIFGELDLSSVQVKSA
jgi:hypothetical protein